jgi:hypothetical protein
MAKLNKAIEKLNDLEDKTCEVFKKKLSDIIKQNISKSGLKGENKALFKQLRGLSKEIVVSGINMGTKWLKN